MEFKNIQTWSGIPFNVLLITVMPKVKVSTSLAFLSPMIFIRLAQSWRPFAFSTFEMAARRRSEFDSVYSTKTNNNLRAVLTTNRY